MGFGHVKFCKHTLSKKAIHERINTLYIQEYKYEDKNMVCPQSFFNMSFGLMNPFGMGMVTSPMIYDMLSTNSYNMQNLHYNYLFADMQARSFSNFMPSLFGGSFMPYQMNGGMFQTLPLPKNVDELARSCGMYGNSFGFGMLTPLTPGSQSGQSKVEESQADAKTRGKINKLQTLLKEVLTKVKDKDGDLYQTINHAVNTYHKEKTVDDQYKVLKTAYDELVKSNRSLLKDCLKDNVTLDGTTMSEILTKAGYENPEGNIDDIIVDLKTAINSGDPSKIAEDQILGALFAESKTLNNLTEKDYMILDIISSWNSAKNENDKNDKNIIKFAMAQKNEDNAEDWHDDVITPIAKVLTKKARNVIKTEEEYLSEKQKESIRELYKDVDDALGNVKDEYAESDSANELAEKFEKLYVALRVATAEIASKKVNEKFGFLDDDETFKDLYIQETKEDLEEEGLGKLAKQYIKENVTQTPDNKPSGEVSNNGGEVTVENVDDGEDKDDDKNMTDAKTKYNEKSKFEADHNITLNCTIGVTGGDICKSYTYLYNEGKVINLSVEKFFGHNILGTKEGKAEVARGLDEYISRINKDNVLAALKDFKDISFYGDNFFKKAYETKIDLMPDDQFDPVKRLIEPVAKALIANLRERKNLLSSKAGKTALQSKIDELASIKYDDTFGKEEYKKLYNIASQYFDCIKVL